MPSCKCDARSTQGNFFLVIETPTLHMHVSTTQIFDAGPLATEGGGVGIALISDNDRLCWGFNADSELVHDLDVFVEMVQTAYERVAVAARG